MNTNRVHRYQNDAIEVQYEAKRCIHAAECVRRLNEVFDAGKRPWIQPDHASADAIAETIHHCPTGALHYTRLDGTPGEPVPSHNTLTVMPEGPLYLRGALAFVSASGETALKETRAALCRCGASQNKPFCDNSHRQAGFADPGVMDTTRETTGVPTSLESALVITARPNGPVRIQGTLEMRDTAGSNLYRDDVFLCRCGHSANKPFCDGSHKKVGFVAE